MNKQIQFALAGLVVAAIVLAGFYFLYWVPHQTPPAPAEPIHWHADFKVYLDNNAFDFSQSKYQSVEGNELSERIHLHENDGNVIHIEGADVLLGEFFNSIGMKFSSTCFVTDTNKSYCDGAAGQLKFFVNGQINTQFENYVPQDLDRILIAYGNETPEQLQQELDSVTDNACIESGKCPERGTP
ncbi:MAG: hypothetical protein Q7R47_02100, partial [Candidatus Diapherotrites archaeon]|nr:hypothetical protein [Candidatus Diapherotrites archaeon]